MLINGSTAQYTYKAVILSEQRESKDLRTKYLLSSSDSAKILRLHFISLRMTGLRVSRTALSLTANSSLLAPNS